MEQNPEKLHPSYLTVTPTAKMDLSGGQIRRLKKKIKLADFCLYSFCLLEKWALGCALSIGELGDFPLWANLYHSKRKGWTRHRSGAWLHSHIFFLLQKTPVSIILIEGVSSSIGYLLTGKARFQRVRLDYLVRPFRIGKKTCQSYENISFLVLQEIQANELSFFLPLCDQIDKESMDLPELLPRWSTRSIVRVIINNTANHVEANCFDQITMPKHTYIKTWVAYWRKLPSAILVIQKKNRCHSICILGVVPEQRGNGIAKSLLLNAFNYIHGRWEVSCDSRNVSMLGLMKDLGFRHKKHKNVSIVQAKCDLF